MRRSPCRTDRWSRHRCRLGWTLLGLLLVGCRAPAPEPAEVVAETERRLALLVVLDAARPDRFGCYGYEREATPNLDALAARGMLFREHRTTATTTRQAVPQLLWSRHFIPPLLPVSAQIPLRDTADLHRGPGHGSESLPRLLGRSGFDRVAISAHPWICAGNEGLQDFGQIVSVRPEPGVSSSAYASAGPVVDAAIEWLEAHPEGDAFLYLHLMDTHFPHALGPEARAFLGEGAATPLPDPLDERPLRDLDRPLTPEERAQLDALVDGSLAHTDHHLGRLFSSLGVPQDRALIVVTADHGDHLAEVPGRVGHDGPWYEAVARIPLIVHYPPALAPGESDLASSTVDVMPTMLRLLNLPLPLAHEVDGRSLVTPLPGDAAPVAFSTTGVLVGDDKCLFHDPVPIVLGLEASPRPLSGERYDLSLDPLETVDLWDDDEDAVQRCRDAYGEQLVAIHGHYWMSHRRETPLRLPVALAVDALSITPDQTHLELAPDQPLGEVLATGWQRLSCGKRTLLATGGGELPATVQVPVPEGRYQVTLGALGTARVGLAGGEPTTIRLRPVSPDRSLPGRFDEVAIGVVEVEQDGFHIVLEPDAGASPFLLRHVELAPVFGEGSPDATVPTGLDEQLRALGYID